ncbi:hypothetical protein RE6C_03380 [Rhodopirellula europaea 6C]|uniref:Uncharacterized protein n=1 Tax=Rhodopirellula europaea 6C TaxID=1263867 RepID=M2B274_9BACT|nr:hypothetical protein RE6C_03380 [Rhodopirellula europaea 6C]
MRVNASQPLIGNLYDQIQKVDSRCFSGLRCPLPRNMVGESIGKGDSGVL